MRICEDFFLQKIAPLDFYIAKHQKKKFDCQEKNAFNLDYFGGSPMTSVCNIAIDGKVISQTSKMVGGNTAKKKQTTLVIYKDGKAEMKLLDKLDNISNLLYAIGGIPFMIDGKEVSLSKDIKPQGWSGGNFYKTWHTFLTVQDGKIWYIGCNIGSSNDVTATTVIYNKLKQIGCTGTVIKLDGGGSFFLRVNDEFIASTDENRTVNYIAGWKGITKFSSYQFPFRAPFKFGTLYGEKGSLWKCGWHSGLDIKSTKYGGSGKIYPIAEGQVVEASYSTSYGNNVRVKHKDGCISLYAHMAKILTHVGQNVGLNTVLGIEGTTGNSTGVHLHIEVHPGGVYKYPSQTDPMGYIENKIREEEEMNQETITKTKIKLCGKIKEVNTINKDGNNYVKLRDLVCDQIGVDYDSQNNLPEVFTK